MREIEQWFSENLPAGIFAGHPTVTVDREEITVTGTIPEQFVGDPGSYREHTRHDRIAVAARAEDIFGRKVAWGVADGEHRVLFTHLAVPVMTRLRQPERQVLDTLVSAGVARSRADALAWCVRLVGEHESDWIARMRDALHAVHEARDSGPGSSADAE